MRKIRVNKIKALTLFATHHFELTSCRRKWKALPTSTSTLEHGAIPSPLCTAANGDGARPARAMGSRSPRAGGVPKEVIGGARGRNCASWRAFLAQRGGDPGRRHADVATAALAGRDPPAVEGAGES
ncbi:hypothetical protein MJ575_23160 [Klebsiella pneumoniae]|nr:hypothetical protein MJ575_23160 [Klebsiella pneumoniae]